jgi:hypothetical protein
MPPPTALTCLHAAQQRRCRTAHPCDRSQPPHTSICLLTSSNADPPCCSWRDIHLHVVLQLRISSCPRQDLAGAARPLSSRPASLLTPVMQVDQDNQLKLYGLYKQVLVDHVPSLPPPHPSHSPPQATSGNAKSSGAPAFWDVVGESSICCVLQL